jgi:hypothetical protein
VSGGVLGVIDAHRDAPEENGGETAEIEMP